MGKSVASKIPNSKKLFSDYLGESSRVNIILNPCSTAEINKLISGLNWSKASGPYSIPCNIIRSFKDVFVEPITSLVNKSLAEGIFSEIFKWASVLLFSKRMIKQNVLITYRPISLISNISKIFERVIYNRIKLFLNEFDII